MNTDAKANKKIGSFYIIIIGVHPACHWVRFCRNECWAWTEEDGSSSAVWLVILQVLILHCHITSLPGILQTAVFKKQK